MGFGCFFLYRVRFSKTKFNTLKGSYKNYAMYWRVVSRLLPPEICISFGRGFYISMYVLLHYLYVLSHFKLMKYLISNQYLFHLKTDV